MGSESKARFLRREVLELLQHVEVLGKLPPEDEAVLVDLRQSKAFRRAQVVAARKHAKHKRRAAR